MLTQLVVALPNGASLASAGSISASSTTPGTLWMLSVHETWQSLGVGTLLIRRSEEAILAAAGRRRSSGSSTTIRGRDDLYGGSATAKPGSELDSWPAGDNRIYVTVCTVLRRRLR